MLEKAEAHAKGMISDPERLTGFLSELDASPIDRRVLSACDVAEEALSKLCQLPPPMRDTPHRGLAELKLQIERTASFVRSVDPGQLESAGDKPITLNTSGQEITLKGTNYLLDYVIPSFHLHATAVFHILRQVGVELDDRDYGVIRENTR